MKTVEVASTLADQIDEYGKLEKKLAKYKKDFARLEALKEKIKKELPDGQAAGSFYCVRVTPGNPFDILDTDKIKANMPPEWQKEYSKKIVRRSLTCFAVERVVVETVEIVPKVTKRRKAA